MTYQSGRHFLQIPGPTNVPDRVLRAMAAPTIDHRGRSPRTRVHRGSPAFQAVARNPASSVAVGAVAPAPGDRQRGGRVRAGRRQPGRSPGRGRR